MYPGQAGFYYGAGCFETLRADKGRVYRFEEHLERLNRGLGYLGVPDGSHLCCNALLEEVGRLLQKNKLNHTHARVRIQVSLDERTGYHPTAEPPGLIRLTTTTEIPPQPAAVSLATVQTQVVPSACRPASLKLSNMLHYRNAFREARKKGAGDGLMLTTGGHVAETSMANIFWKTGDTIFTPSAECDILTGIMRNDLLGILEEKKDIRVEQGKFRRKELDEAGLIWLTNSIFEIMPVSSLDERTLTVQDPFYDEIRKGLQSLKEEYFN